MKMKNTRKIHRTPIIAIILLLVGALVGCSDGENWEGSGGPDFNVTPAPMILGFYAEPAEIKAGESTTIHWKVADADEISIVAISSGEDPVPFSVQTSDLEGSAPVTALLSDTDFVLTATKTTAVLEGEGEAMMFKARGQEVAPPEDPGTAPPEVGGTSVSQKITVKVNAPVQIVAKFSADKLTLTPPESTQAILTWEVTPAEGVNVEITADSGEPVIATDQCGGDAEDAPDDINIPDGGDVPPGGDVVPAEGADAISRAADEAPSDAIPVSGCAVVEPSVKTTYTLKATDKNDPANVVEQTLTIDVAEVKLEIQKFTINNDPEHATIPSYTTPVKLDWKVVPKGAKVTITAEPAAICELPTSKESAGESETVSCQISANTTFTLSAKLDEGEPQTRVVHVARQISGGGADVKITADSWALPGEEVEVKVEPPAGGAAAITKVSIDDDSQAAGRVEVPGFGADIAITKKVKMPKLGVRVRWECAGCDEPRDTLAVTAFPVASKPFQFPIVRIAPVLGADGTFLYGANAGYNDGKAFVFRSGVSLDQEQAMSFDFASALLSLDNLATYLNPEFLPKLDYPVGAVGVAKSGRIYAGTSGALMYSDDKGSTWKLFDQFYGYANKDHPYPGSHPSCAGETQKGNKSNGSNTIATLHQFCDILTFGEKGIMVATDRGVFTISDADGFLGNRNDKTTNWKGGPAEGKSFDAGAEFLTFTRVANDLEQVDSKVFTATSKGSGKAAGGVFVTADNGKSWEAFGLDDTDVFSLAYDKEAKKLYAGTKDGVQVSGVDAAKWEAVGSVGKAVYSLAVDPYSTGGVLIAGTAEGVSILRNAKAKGEWKSVDVGGTDKIRAVAMNSVVNDKAGMVEHFLSIGTAKGAISGALPVRMSSAVAPAPPAIPETPPTAPADPAVPPPPAVDQPPANQPPTVAPGDEPPTN